MAKNRTTVVLGDDRGIRNMFAIASGAIGFVTGGIVATVVAPAFAAAALGATVGMAVGASVAYIGVEKAPKLAKYLASLSNPSLEKNSMKFSQAAFMAKDRIMSGSFFSSLLAAPAASALVTKLVIG